MAPPQSAIAGGDGIRTTCRSPAWASMECGSCSSEGAPHQWMGGGVGIPVFVSDVGMQQTRAERECWNPAAVFAAVPVWCGEAHLSCGKGEAQVFLGTHRHEVLRTGWQAAWMTNVSNDD